MEGGGVFSCTLSNCALAGNAGGGALGSTLDDCTVSNNVSHSSGGGASQSTLSYCLLCNNQGGRGGGAYNCTLNFCTVSNNVTSGNGGGVCYDSNQTNTLGQGNIIVGNVATDFSTGFGGGVFLGISSNLYNWTFISNSAAGDGGGLYLAGPSIKLNDCTFLGNSSDGNGGGFCGAYPSLTSASNCTFIGNIAVGNGGGAYSAALTNSTVVGNKAGNGGGVYGTVNNCVVNDNTAATNGGGLYYYSGGSAQPVVVKCAFTNDLAVNGGGVCNGVFSNCIFSANLAVTNGGGIYIAALNDCLVISNRAAFGGGASVGGDSEVFYPGTSATYIDCKVIGNSASADGGGIYDAFPSTMTNCVIEYNSATNNGGGVFLGMLGSCTVISNTAGANGGGTYQGNLSYCILSGNSAGNNGGGAYMSTPIVNCLLTGNIAAHGGGEYNGSIDNSTVVNNTAMISGGGIINNSGAAVASCIIYDNSAPTDENYVGSANYCCVTPLPSGGTSNITNDPAFVDFASVNFRLQTNSPCINAGSGSPGPKDLDGRPRVVGGRIDIGAYEFQGPGMGEFIGWLQQYGLPTDGSVDYADLDGTGFTVYQDWIAGLNPTNALSVLAMLPPVPTKSPMGLVVSWESESNRTYFLQSSTNLAAQPAFTTMQSNIVGQPNTTSFMDTNAVGNGPFFYRVGVQQ